jgi:hypothetical protein
MDDLFVKRFYLLSRRQGNSPRMSAKTLGLRLEGHVRA